MTDREATELSVDEVSVSFGALVALDRVSLRVRRGEIVGLIGPNGAGKTTLFNVICGFVRPASGTISFDGRPLRRHRPHDLAKLGIARTLQGVGLFPGLTVLENVLAGAQPQRRSGFLSALAGVGRSRGEEARVRHRAERVLAELGIAGYADERPGALPYGIAKRAAIARALVADPSLLLLDEPASGLAADDMAELARLVSSLRSRMGVLLVEHRMDFVLATCERLVVLDFGRVIAAGAPEAVTADPAVATAYLGEAVRAPDGRPRTAAGR